MGVVRHEAAACRVAENELIGIAVITVVMIVPIHSAIHSAWDRLPPESLCVAVRGVWAEGKSQGGADRG